MGEEGVRGGGGGAAGRDLTLKGGGAFAAGVDPSCLAALGTLPMEEGL